MKPVIRGYHQSNSPFVGTILAAVASIAAPVIGGLGKKKELQQQTQQYAMQLQAKASRDKQIFDMVKLLILAVVGVVILRMVLNN